jgi:hypothetical protein
MWPMLNPPAVGGSIEMFASFASSARVTGELGCDHSASVEPETLAIEVEGAIEVEHGECDYVNARIHRPPLVRVGSRDFPRLRTFGERLSHLPLRLARARLNCYREGGVAGRRAA